MYTQGGLWGQDYPYLILWMAGWKSHCRWCRCFLNGMGRGCVHLQDLLLSSILKFLPSIVGVLVKLSCSFWTSLSLSSMWANHLFHLSESSHKRSTSLTTPWCGSCKSKLFSWSKVTFFWSSTSSALQYLQAPHTGYWCMRDCKLAPLNPFWAPDSWHWALDTHWKVQGRSTPFEGTNHCKLILLSPVIQPFCFWSNSGQTTCYKYGMLCHCCQPHGRWFPCPIKPPFNFVLYLLLGLLWPS